MGELLRKQIGASLQARRKAGGYSSASAMADKLGISQSKYTEYEQGRVPCPLEIAWDVANILNCSLDELAGREWPAAPALSPDESSLVDSFRSMSGRQRDGLLMLVTSAADGGSGKN